MWSSFLTGQNKEKEATALGDKEMWNFKVNTEDTFLNNINAKVIDLPTYNYETKHHEKERKLMKDFFEDKGDSEKIKKEYNVMAFEHHKKIKEELHFSTIKQRN